MTTMHGVNDYGQLKVYSQSMQKQLSQSQLKSSFNLLEFCIPNRSDLNANSSQNQLAVVQ